MALERFSPATQAWFTGAFAAPTSAQEGAWDAISQGQDTLVVAPTGSGKTLSAFLWSLDKLASAPPPDDPKRRCRVLYVSPLKALAGDVERPQRGARSGIRQAAQRLDRPVPDRSPPAPVTLRPTSGGRSPVHPLTSSSPHRSRCSSS